MLAGAVGDKRMLSTSRYSFAKAVTAPMKHAFYVAHMPMALRMAFNAARFNTTLGRVGPGTGFDEAGGTFARGGGSRHIKTGPQGDPLHNLAFMRWLLSAKAVASQPASTRSSPTWQAQQKNCTQILRPRF